MVNKALKNKIIADLEKAGFPAEMAASMIISAEPSWLVYNNPLFKDAEENKSREVDIHAVHVNKQFAKVAPKRFKPGNENKLITHLIIEVKKSERPWVFFQTQSFIANLPHESLKSKIDVTSFFMFKDLKVRGWVEHRYLKEPIHKNFYAAFMAPNQPSSINEAAIKVVKAVEYFKARYGVGGYALHVFIPMIVVDGSLWSAKLDRHNKLKLKEVDSLFLETGLLSYQKPRKLYFEREQLVEVVTLKGFKKYFNRLQNDNENLYNAWTSHIASSIKH